MSARPAWSWQFDPQELGPDQPTPMGSATPDWAWGDSTGRGVKVAVIDSGIDASHPAVGGSVDGYVEIAQTPDGPAFVTEPHADSFGHGTACAGIIRDLAPDCELYSVRILGPNLRGRGTSFIEGLRWAVENGIRVCNLSLGTTKKDYREALHELADEAYFKDLVLVTAANNLPVPSYPSLYASVISVAAHSGQQGELLYYNPHPPVEFGAPGIDVRVAWLDGSWITATGNSYAAPHVTGLVARIIAKHPHLRVFELKTILRALSANVDTRSAS